MLIAQGLNPVMHNRLAWIWSNTGIMLKWRSNLNENYEHLQRRFAHVRNEVLISLCANRFVVRLHRPTCFKVCNTQFALSTAMAKCIRYALPVRMQPWELMCYNLAFADEAFCAKISSKGCICLAHVVIRAFIPGQILATRLFLHKRLALIIQWVSESLAISLINETHTLTAYKLINQK